MIWYVGKTYWLFQDKKVFEDIYKFISESIYIYNN